MNENKADLISNSIVVRNIDRLSVKSSLDAFTDHAKKVACRKTSIDISLPKVYIISL